ncbi:MAG: hypothetical protein K1X72_23185 [Pyrinomonadaceae bacterium]|nr:hypothetical protein [Pyrinomonadaceae bacterium]
MKRNFLFVILTVLIFTTISFGQSNKVLAKGNPNLTENSAARMQSVFEWTFQKAFDAEQAKHFRQILIGYWQKNLQNNIQSCQDYLKIADLIEKVPADQAESVRGKLLAAISEAVQKEPNDEMSQLLVEVSENAQTVENNNESFSNGGNISANLVGTWVARRGSGSGYINPNTGATNGPNATVHSYTFRSNGTFEYAILMQSSLYQCTTTINGYEAGAFQANDSAIGFVTKKATKSYKDSCRPNLNSNGAAEIPAPKKLYYRFARDEQNNLNLCLSDEAGRSSCFVKQ